MTAETLEKYARTFQRTADGGWLEKGACFPDGSTARICAGAFVFAGAASQIHGGVFHGGEFHGGRFHGGLFHGGKISDGVFYGGEFHDGVFLGGEFHAGEFHGGEFHGGVFHGGEFHGGDFHGGYFDGGEFHGGHFCNGDFHAGEFHGGYFDGGEFHGGRFHGGWFRGGVFHQSPCSAQRSDGYMFVAKYVGPDLRIWAGCRNFSWAQAVAHWNDDHPRGAESQRIIHFLRAQADAEKERWGS